MFVILNGNLISEEKAHWSIQDRGFLLGDGFFTTIRCQPREILFAKEHFSRLENSAQIFQFPFFYTFENFISWVNQLLKANDLFKKEAAVRVTMTRGIGVRGVVPPLDPQISFLMTAQSYAHPQQPFQLIISSYKKDVSPPLSLVKHLGYQTEVLASLEARQTGADDALLFNSHGHLVSSTKGNVIIQIDENTLWTPPLSDGALPGIYRQYLLNFYKGNLKEHSITQEDLRKTQKIFISNSLLGMHPVFLKNLD